MRSQEFIIESTRYLVESETCGYACWNKLCDKIQKSLMTFQANVAAKSVSMTATVMIDVEFNKTIYPIRLTINPQGNNFR